MHDETETPTHAYTIRNGRIADPGRYEGEPAYTPMFHGFWLDGLHDQADGDTALFFLDAGDYALFPELAGFTMVALYVTEADHVTAYPLTHDGEPN